MALFCISDLHLPLGVDKPMDIFGGNWENYVEKIKKNWLENIADDDYIVLPGDFCWAMRLDEARPDFDFIEALPGIKILLKGNHDYWWDTISKLERFMGENCYSSINFLHNNAYLYKNTALCGTRFWTCPGASPFTAEDEKIYLRELGRAELTLKPGILNDAEDIIFFTHYPPVRSESEPDSGFAEIMKRYGVRRVVYGHLHGPACKNGYVGVCDRIEYILASADYLDFMPIKLAD